VHFVNPEGTIEIVENGGTWETRPANGACPGTVSEPKATPGDLCVYQGRPPSTAQLDEVEEIADAVIRRPDPEGFIYELGGAELGAAPTGAMVIFPERAASEEAVFDFGTWAVTAEE
jgi:hypothetical protein